MLRVGTQVHFSRFTSAQVIVRKRSKGIPSMAKLGNVPSRIVEMLYVVGSVNRKGHPISKCGYK